MRKYKLTAIPGHGIGTAGTNAVIEALRGDNK